MALSSDLFDPRIPLTWLPDETLFGLCSRHHLLSGNHLSSSTCKQLFGHPTRGAAHDFPSRIGHFAVRTNAQLGTAEQIIRLHTILPFYLPFSSPAIASLAQSAMCGASIGSLKFQLGLLTSRFRAHHPLKACWACMRNDRDKWSTAYWHRNHQLPGVWTCPEHGTLLVHSTLKSTGVLRFQWLLPAKAHLPPPHSIDQVPASITMMAKNALGLTSLSPNTHFDAVRVNAVLRVALRDRGLLRGDGKGHLLSKEVGRQYARYIAPLRQIEELGALPASEEIAAKEVARLVGDVRNKTHPLRYLVLIGWLFGDLDLFVDRYRAFDVLSSQDRFCGEITGSTKPRRNDDLRLKLLDLVASGCSVSGAARQIGVDPATAMAWAASAGIETTKRPSVIKGDVRQKMMMALMHGSCKTVAERIGGVSLASVTRLLRTEVGLNDAWRAARFTKAQHVARKKWLRIIAANPHSGINAVRLLEPAAFAWLYRWDRDWLDAQSEQIRSVRCASGLRVDWDARDRSLAKEIAEVSLDLATAAPAKKIKLWQIYQRIPQLKAKLSTLDRLPLTRDAIQRVLKATSEESTLFRDTPGF